MGEEEEEDGKGKRRLMSVRERGPKDMVCKRKKCNSEGDSRLPRSGFPGGRYCKHGWLFSSCVDSM